MVNGAGLAMATMDIIKVYKHNVILSRNRVVFVFILHTVFIRVLMYMYSLIEL